MHSSAPRDVKTTVLFIFLYSKRRRTPTQGEKSSKGLRHFAMLVCEKVKNKITTTYNEVADELVTEYANEQRQYSEQVQVTFNVSCFREIIALLFLSLLSAFSPKITLCSFIVGGLTSNRD